MSKSKVLIVVGDGAEVIDSMVPYYRLGEDFDTVIGAPERRTYHLVQHEHDPNWDITVEMPGYTIASDVAFRDVDPDEYIGLVLPGRRAPEFLRYAESPGACDLEVEALRPVLGGFGRRFSPSNQCTQGYQT